MKKALFIFLLLFCSNKSTSLLLTSKSENNNNKEILENKKEEIIDNNKKEEGHIKCVHNLFLILHCVKKAPKKMLILNRFNLDKSASSILDNEKKNEDKNQSE